MSSRLRSMQKRMRRKEHLPVYAKGPPKIVHKEYSEAGQIGDPQCRNSFKTTRFGQPHFRQCRKQATEYGGMCRSCKKEYK